MHSLVNSSQKSIAVWLLICCISVFAMVVLGGVTRLTQSGLSMVNWQPIMGVVPPLTETEWQDAFREYQRFPEYQKINQDMTLAEFKPIFWFEYAHRILGRAIGLIFLIPFLFFWFAQRIPRPLLPKLIGVFCLGGLQGLLGWYMVKSGLVSEPHVSPYRLTAHLALAVLIYGYMLWLVLGLITGGKHKRSWSVDPPWRLSVFVTVLVGVIIISGGFVAGTKAGFAFNTFPTMNGDWVPQGIWALQPAWRNLFENLATVQFTHRVIALALAVLVAVLWLSVLLTSVSPQVRLATHGLLAMLVMQITLGVTTLINTVPVSLAAMHQGGGLLVLTTALWVTHGLLRDKRAYRL
jgi:cytochrome c oxidase assembly protein subunit 15